MPLPFGVLFQPLAIACELPQDGRTKGSRGAWARRVLGEKGSWVESWAHRSKINTPIHHRTVLCLRPIDFPLLLYVPVSKVASVLVNGFQRVTFSQALLLHHSIPHFPSTVWIEADVSVCCAVAIITHNPADREPWPLQDSCLSILEFFPS